MPLLRVKRRLSRRRCSPLLPRKHSFLEHNPATSLAERIDFTMKILSFLAEKGDTSRREEADGYDIKRGAFDKDSHNLLTYCTLRF